MKDPPIRMLYIYRIPVCREFHTWFPFTTALVTEQSSREGRHAPWKSHLILTFAVTAWAIYSSSFEPYFLLQMCLIPAVIKYIVCLLCYFLLSIPKRGQCHSDSLSQVLVATRWARPASSATRGSLNAHTNTNPPLTAKAVEAAWSEPGAHG